MTAPLDRAEFEAIEVTRGDFVRVRLNRPEVRNAIDQRMVDELHAVCAEVERDPRVVVISGSPPAVGADGRERKGVFASGADIRQLRERRRDDALAGINSGIFERINALPMPVIAALDGYCLGGGAELAYAADLRIGTPDVRIGNPEPGLGILAAAGASWRLKELIGEARALEILLAGRVVDGETALAWGLITRLVPSAELEAAAAEMAAAICAQDPLAIKLTKEVFRAPREAHPLADRLAQATLFESPAKFERMSAFLERKSTR
ncbi:enoyl-CoA hydratase/isomerase family protein [Falsarthrobacter nasiphocae]|uniref:Enoyl-CoA hydratase n=1 Tax=Falsarthrobacter nasiphocae TaxID=189863 RepID=A0AAE4C6B0_9MICC|nr:enoyl-CoA hydratase/isomerase family protein [Falsarthrobacter nasiphocae]MDR6892388.1 enoyl-CoA hydratase [Falsarthrobacter nasiphocae]